ncbi:hypothetical protein [Vannielia litorea]|uniref:hypothetical protein n=1 Tax=Vannielia litorea TaxID=1217970 RepID=UPI001BCBF3E5|nr:hypothetical protein [Vannielia litorea]MBS8228638.1 hypothetical protein [Vannielia litorea]
MKRRHALLAGLSAFALAPLATACNIGAGSKAGSATAGPRPPASGPAKGTATMEQDGLTLRARIEAQPDENALTLAYRVDNQGAGPAYVYDKLVLHDPERGQMADAGRAYVYPLPDAGEVLVMKDVPPLPEGLQPTQLAVPLMVRLAPGDAIEGALRFSLPLRPWREYLNNELAFPRQDTVEVLRLRIGYALPPEGAEESSFAYAGETAFNFRNPPGVRHRQSALELRFETPGLPIFLPE